MENTAQVNSNTDNGKGARKISGIILVIIGVCLMGYAAINYYNTDKVVADVGTVEVTGKKEDPVIWQPILGGAITVAGLMMITKRRKDKF